MSLAAWVAGSLAAVLFSGLAPAAGQTVRGDAPNVAPFPVQSFVVTANPRSPTVEEAVVVTAKLSCDGQPEPDREGWPVTFDVISGPHEGLSGSDVLDAAGVAQFRYGGTGAGLDVVTATIGGEFGGCPGRSSPRATVRIPWALPPPEPPELTVTATPDGSTGRIGTPFAIHVSVLLDGKPAPRPDVTMTASMVGQPDIVPAPTRTASGDFAFEYTRTTPGSDRIVVSATVDIVGVPHPLPLVETDTLTRTWIAREPPNGENDGDDASEEPSESDESNEPGVNGDDDTGNQGPPDPATDPDLDLTPDGVTSLVGTQFGLTMRVTDEERGPVQGVRIALQILAADGSSEEVAVTTDNQGLARHRYSRSEAGEEQVVAIVETARGPWANRSPTPGCCPPANASRVKGTSEPVWLPAERSLSPAPLAIPRPWSPSTARLGKSTQRRCRGGRRPRLR